jgi:hypothetical protein
VFDSTLLEPPIRDLSDFDGNDLSWSVRFQDALSDSFAAHRTRHVANEECRQGSLGDRAEGLVVARSTDPMFGWDADGSIRLRGYHDPFLK